MFKFFESIAGFISTIVGYVVGLIQLLLNLVKFIFKAQAFLLEVVQALPPFLIIFAVLIISIAILFQILNKGS